MDARFAGNQKLVRFYTERLTQEIRTAYDGWLAQNPFENPKADPHPFVPHLYKLPFADEADQARSEEARHTRDAEAAGTHSARYLSHTVLLAAVLFFGGTAGNFDRRIVRQSTLFFAVATFLYCVMRIAGLPVA